MSRSSSLFEAVDISDSERGVTLTSNAEHVMEIESRTEEFPEISFKEEAHTSLTIVSDNRLNWLLLCGPVAFIGSSYGFLGDTSCFCLSGLALIPSSER